MINCKQLTLTCVHLFFPSVTFSVRHALNTTSVEPATGNFADYFQIGKNGCP